MTSGIIYPELSYSIIGAAMDVHNELGPGWDEWDYHRAMLTALTGRGHQVVSHDRRSLEYKGRVVEHFELDLLVDDLAILELKQLKSDFHPNNYTQLINYLKQWDKRLGILINYGQEKLRYKRLPYSEGPSSVLLDEAWESMSGVCNFVHTAVLNILSSIGIGYSADIFKKLVRAELDANAYKVTPLIACPMYGGKSFGERELDALLIEENLILTVSAASSSSDLYRLCAYMKQSGIAEGVLVDMSDSNINLRGVQV